MKTLSLLFLACLTLAAARPKSSYRAETPSVDTASDPVKKPLKAGEVNAALDAGFDAVKGIISGQFGTFDANSLAGLGDMLVWVKDFAKETLTNVETFSNSVDGKTENVQAVIAPAADFTNAITGSTVSFLQKIAGPGADTFSNIISSSANIAKNAAPAFANLPSISEFDIPKISIPNIDASKFVIPEIVIPDFSSSKIVIPDFNIPKVVVPEVVVPEVVIPEVVIPDIKVPSFETAKVEVPAEVSEPAPSPPRKYNRRSGSKYA